MNETSIILSIKPEFCWKIFSGIKKLEFRKKIWKKETINKIYLYSSTPIQKIVGYFRIKRIYHGSPRTLWYFFKHFAGISKDAFFKYFEGCSEGYAIVIDAPFQCPVSIDPKDLDPEFKAPQNFMYLKNELLARKLSKEMKKRGKNQA